MASSEKALGTGAAITFVTSAFTAELLNVAWDGIGDVAVIDVPHMTTVASGAGIFGNKPKLIGTIADPGSLTADIHFNPDTRPPVETGAEAVTLTFGETATWAGSGGVTGFSFGVPLEDVMTGSLTVSFAGPITVTAAA